MTRRDFPSKAHILPKPQQLRPKPTPQPYDVVGKLHEALMGSITFEQGGPLYSPSGCECEAVSIGRDRVRVTLLASCPAHGQVMKQRAP